MKIGIIGPSEDEIKSFIEKIENRQAHTAAMLSFYSGSFEGIEVVALYCGVCKVNAAICAQILIDKFNVTHIIVCGVAGAISNLPNIGDTVICTEAAYHDVADEILTEYHPWMKSIYFNADYGLLAACRKTAEENTFLQKIYFGKGVTGEAFININGRKEIIEKFNPLCVDMETAAVAHVCYVNKTPFIAIRSISDTEKESGDDNFQANLNLAAKNSLCFLQLLLKKLS